MSEPMNADKGHPSVIIDGCPCYMSLLILI